MTAKQTAHNIPVIVWQVLLMGLLGMTGIVFIPLLVRLVDAALLAQVLVAQVFVYYLVLLTQYGFAWTGPAALAQAQANAPAAAQLWRASVQAKLLLLCGPVALACGVGYVLWGEGMPHLWLFAGLLLAYALHSNWLLQARGSFASGVLVVLAGLVGSVGLLGVLMAGVPWPQGGGTQGALVVAILVLPQCGLGVASWWRAKRLLASELAAAKAAWPQPLPLPGVLAMLRKDAPLVGAQLLLLASTTLGTVVVGALANGETTAAYAATEKLFNLGATVLVGVYTALYPSFASLYYNNRAAYWAKTRALLGFVLAAGLLLAWVLAVWGRALLAVYVTEPLAAHVAPILAPFGIWLALCLSQHVLTGYLVLAGHRGQVLLLNAAVLGVTLALGAGLAYAAPVHWVYGMIAGQLLAVAWLARCYVLDRVGT